MATDLLALLLFIGMVLSLVLWRRAEIAYSKEFTKLREKNVSLEHMKQQYEEKE